MRSWILVVVTLTGVGVQPSLSWRNGHHNPGKSKFRSADVSHLSMVQGQLPNGYLGYENIPSLRQYHGTTIPVEVKVESHLPEIHHSERVLEAKHLETVSEVKHSEASLEVKHSDASPEVKHSDSSSEVRRSESAQEVQNSGPSSDVQLSEPSPEVKNSEPSSEVQLSEPSPEVKNSEPSSEVRHSESAQEVKNSEPSSEVQLSEHGQNVRHSDLVPEVQFLQTSPDLYKSETVTTTQNYITEQEARSSSFTPEFHHSEYFYKTTNSEPEPEFQKQEVSLEFQPTNFPFDLQKHEGEGVKHYRGMTRLRQPEIFTGDANLGFSLNSQLIEETQQTTTELSFISIDPSNFQHEQASYLTRKQVSNFQHEQASNLQHERASSLQHEQVTNLQHERASSLQHEKVINFQHEQAYNLQHEQASNLQHEQASNLQHEQASTLQHGQVPNLQHEQASNLQHEQASSPQNEQVPNLKHKQDSYMPHRQDSNPFLPENPPQDQQEILYQTPLVDFKQQQYNSEMSAGIDNTPQQIRQEHSLESNQELKFSEHDSPKNLNTLEFVERVRDGELSEQGSSTLLNDSPEGIILNPVEYQQRQGSQLPPMGPLVTPPLRDTDHPISQQGLPERPPNSTSADQQVLSDKSSPGLDKVGNTAVSNFDQSSNQTSVNSKWDMLDEDPMPLQSQKGFDFSPPSYHQPNLNNFASPGSYQSMSGLPGSSMGSYGTSMGSSFGSNYGATLGSSMGSSLGSSMGSNYGASLGSSMGSSLGSPIGPSYGSFLGSSMGSNYGSSLGSLMGSSLGSPIGSSYRSSLGSSLGSSYDSSLRSSMGSSLGTPIGSPYGSSLGSSLGSSYDSSLRSSMGSSLGTPIGSPYGSSLRSPLGSSLGSPIGSPYGSPLGSPMSSSHGSPLGSSMGSSYGDSLGSSMGSSMGSSLASSYGSSLGSSMGSSLRSPMGSSYGSSWGSPMGSSHGSSLGSSMGPSYGPSLNSAGPSMVPSYGSSLGSSLSSSLGSYGSAMGSSYSQNPQQTSLYGVKGFNSQYSIGSQTPNGFGAQGSLFNGQPPYNHPSMPISPSFPASSLAQPQVVQPYQTSDQVSNTGGAVSKAMLTFSIGSFLDELIPYELQDPYKIQVIRDFLNDDMSLLQARGTDFNASAYRNKGEYLKAIFERCLRSDIVRSNYTLYQAMEEYVGKIRTKAYKSDTVQTVHETSVQINMTAAFGAVDIPAIHRDGQIPALKVLYDFLGNGFDPTRHLEGFKQKIFGIRSRGEFIRELLFHLQTLYTLPEDVRNAASIVLNYVHSEGVGAEPMFDM